ncbi:acyl-CoA dehydrogenase [Pigmentiphaga sp. GD03639]|uniref:acyl-CoA dehydrogenase n=1 Tax=Pigmentiphaga sp. GD03639 TaxID=2975354 RepID=UPI00244C3708|nr:acyl-CoA dehydrogenase [Pigmentiphaga sp. GD03639]MDH2236947.1 acyl-CoA dehydrogenase [Pigmentiphaga sp. GD03639]
MDDTLREFRDSAADYLGANDQRQRMRALDDSAGGHDREEWRRIAELGWLAVLVAEDDGGLGLGLPELCAIAQEAGRHLLPEPLAAAGVHTMALLAGLPATPPRASLLEKAMSGAMLLGVAWQERAGQLDPDARPGSCATRGAGGLRLAGRKRFVQPGADVDGWLLAATLDEEAALLWLPRERLARAPITRRLVDGSAQADLDLDGTVLDAEHVLATGPTASEALARANDVARLAQGAELAGIARRALELTRDYLATREQFGRPIGSFQALQHRMVDGLIQVELAEACLREVLAQAAPDAPATRLGRLASRAKARCAHAALEMTRMAIQLHGAIGTTYEYDIGLYFRRAMALSAHLGNAEAHRVRYATLAAPEADDPETGPAPAPITAFPADADWGAMPEAEFRRLVRALFDTHYPQDRRHMPYRQTWAETRDWYLTLARLGWLAPAWPREHGGMGLPPDKLIAYIEEAEAYGVARPPDQGLNMVGPILMRFGTDAQRARFLPAILKGEHVWIQGYSEPNAGSDLAAVRTEAVPDGDHFVVNGQKTWTTWGSDGTHMFMLVRTDKTAKKQAGISFLLVDLKTPGITVRPIRNIADEREFCEVFFDNVRVPRENLVGGLNEGWTVAKALLGFERLFTGSPKHSQHTLRQVEKLARQRGLFDDPAFVARHTALQLDTLDLGAAYGGFADLAKRGAAIPPTVSILKIWSTETYERLALLLIEAAGEYGAVRDHAGTDEIDLHVVAPLFNALGAKIFAGSNEIQRNILAKAVLELPSG